MSALASMLMKAMDNPYVSIAEEGKSAGSMSSFIDTGSYVLNAVISGSLFGGIPDNKITMFAGEESTGKTFFSLSIVKNFLDADPEAVVVYFETEGAISKEMLKARGIDAKRVLIAEVETAEQFKNNAVQTVTKLLEKKGKHQVLFVLDSLGMLSTEKEVADSNDGKNTKDMTRAQVIKACFRTLTLKLSRAHVPLIVVNHVYEAVGQMYADKVVGGGSGSKYAASTIIMLSKAQARGKDTGGAAADINRVGSIISCTASKSRLTVEKTKVKTLLHSRHGLDKYFGLFDIAVDAGMLVKDGNRYSNTQTGELKWKKDIVNPKLAHETFTQEFLEELDVYVQANFKYGEIEDMPELPPELAEDYSDSEDEGEE